MDKIIRVEKPLAAYQIVLGKGAIIRLLSATSPVIKFLRERYQDDPSCISGDIESLFKVKGEGLKPYNKFYKQ